MNNSSINDMKYIIKSFQLDKIEYYIKYKTRQNRIILQTILFIIIILIFPLIFNYYKNKYNLNNI